MKKALVLLVFLALFVSAANAQMIGDYCSVQGVDVDTVVESYGSAHVKMTYHFECGGASAYSGQVTKMLITVPYTGIDNLEASDSLGSMKVLEGPEYVKATEEVAETTIGAIFRKGLVIDAVSNAYDLSIEFDTITLVETMDSTYSMKPGGLGATPKVTIVGTGVTETTLPIAVLSFDVTLPEKTAIEQITPSVCQFQGNKVSCSDVSADDFDALEIRWKKTGPTLFGENLNEYMDKVSTIFKKNFSKLSELWE
jgi:hypothetical protein